jgi:hypothetical protein
MRWPGSALAVRMNEHNNGYMTLGRYAVWTSDVNANDKPDLNAITYGDYLTWWYDANYTAAVPKD